MTKTTVYLPDDLKAAVKRMASERQVSEAEIIRDAIRQLGASMPLRPTLPLFSSGDPTLAERVDELMKGFGER